MYKTIISYKLKLMHNTFNNDNVWYTILGCIWLVGIALPAEGTPRMTVEAVPEPPFMTGILSERWYTPPPTPLAPEVDTRIT